MTKLESRFNNFVMERTEDAGKLVIKDIEYLALDNKINNLFDEIGQHLPEDKKHLLNDLESNINNQTALAETCMYKQGLKDGIKFNDFLDR